MDTRKFVAEAVGSFMLVTSVLGAALFATGGPSAALGVALSVGLTATAMLYALGTVSGGHFNPAVTIGLVAAGRFEASRVVAYVLAQCAGAILAAGVFYILIGTGKAGGLASVANGWDQLSPSRSGLLAVLLIEAVLTAFLLIVYVGATSERQPVGFAPLAIGLALVAIHLIALPISNASVNPARSLATALFGGAAAVQQVWVFWLAPIVGAVMGGAFARWLLDE